jgi:hypothetical protein
MGRPVLAKASLGIVRRVRRCRQLSFPSRQAARRTVYVRSAPDLIRRPGAETAHVRFFGSRSRRREQACHMDTGMFYDAFSNQVMGDLAK